jgi:hypothetical protein
MSNNADFRLAIVKLTFLIGPFADSTLSLLDIPGVCRFGADSIEEMDADNRRLVLRDIAGTVAGLISSAMPLID